MNAGQIVGMVILALTIALIVSHESKPKPPKAMLPFCYLPHDEFQSSSCKNVPRYGKA